MPRLLKWAAACKPFTIIIILCPAARKKSAPLCPTLPLFLCLNTARITRSWMNTRNKQFDRIVSIAMSIRVPSSSSLAVFKASPSQSQKLKINKFRPESTIAMTMTAIQCKVTMSFDKRSTRRRVIFDNGMAFDTGWEKGLRARFPQDTYMYSHNKPNWNTTWRSAKTRRTKNEKEREWKKERKQNY